MARKTTREVDLPIEDDEDGWGDLDAWEILPTLTPFSGRRVRITVEDLGPAQEAK